jgi:IPT/TIG domain-containing protein/putative pyrroloquinoline-quinone-binding quinoprotein
MRRSTQPRFDQNSPTGRRVRRCALVATVALTMMLPAFSASAATATAVPVITSFSPSSGPVGTKVTILGSGFASGQIVTFNGVAANKPTFNAAGTKIVANVPPFATSGLIRVAQVGGPFDDSSSPFTVTFGGDLAQRRVYPGQKLTIAGSAYPPFDDLTFSAGGSSMGGAATDANGNFRVMRTVPDIGPGKTLDLTIACQTVACAQVHLPFSLFTDWPQTRLDPEQDASNGSEWLLDTTTATTLHRQYDETAALNTSATMVEQGGRLFYGGGGNNIGEILSIKVGGISGSWIASTTRPVTGLAVSGGVLYAVSWNTLYAFDARGITNCSNGQCNPLWTASFGSSTFPYPPVVSHGLVLVAGSGNPATLSAYDAAGSTNCSGSPTVCTPLWSDTFTALWGPPVVSSDGLIYIAKGGVGSNTVLQLNGFGVAINESANLGGTRLFGPALSGTGASGTVFVTRWNGATATLVALDSGTVGVNASWASSALGGGDVPSIPALSAKRAFVANSVGRLLAFKIAGCGAATCDPIWTSKALGAGNSAAPIVAGGVVFHAANAAGDSRGLDLIYAFDEQGQTNCSGAPKVCLPVATVASNIQNQPGTVGDPGGMLEAGGIVYGVGGDGWTAFVR